MSLTDEQLTALDRDGYVAPLPLCTAGQMAELRSAIDTATATRGPCHGDPWTARHQDCAVVHDICAHPLICGPVARVLGPDLVIWNSVLMNKAPGDGEIPWHQDHDFDYLSPDVGLAVWLAIDDATEANGCLEVIPGSHRAAACVHAAQPARRIRLPRRFRGRRRARPSAHRTARGRVPVVQEQDLAPVSAESDAEAQAGTRHPLHRSRRHHRHDRVLPGYRAVAVSAADSAPPPASDTIAATCAELAVAARDPRPSAPRAPYSRGVDGVGDLALLPGVQCRWVMMHG